MASIQLTSGFQLHPEGEFDFVISEVNEKEIKFNKLTITLVDQNGKDIKQNYNLNNDGARGAFSVLVKAAFGDWDMQELSDPQDLVGKFIHCEVEHDKVPKKDDPSKTMTFIHLNNISECQGWAGEVATSTVDPNSLDIDEILG